MPDISICLYKKGLSILVEFVLPQAVNARNGFDVHPLPTTVWSYHHAP
jgi:hypothetical protein